MKGLVKLSQYLVGVLFIISGGIKANDALGFSYKLEEYFDVFAQIMNKYDLSSLASLMEWFSGLALPMAMFICVFEIALGVATIIGYKMKPVTWNMLLMILFFTWLTGYTATCDPYNADNISCVSDCGCFGDAIPLTPFQSFLKDIFLLIFISILFWKRKDIELSIGGKEANILILISVVFPTLFTVYTYRHLPIKDFRTYKEGADIKYLMFGEPGESKFVYILKNKATGEEEKFETWPENWSENYDYVDNEEIVVTPGVEPEITDFSILTEDESGSLVDVKDQFLQDSVTLFILASKGLNYLGDFTYTGGVLNGFDAYEDTKENFKLINTFAEEVMKDGNEMIGLCSNGGGELDEFRNDLQIPFSFYSGDEKVIKTIIRSNPGLILIKDGVIIKKWHINDFPSYEDVKEEFLK